MRKVLATLLAVMLIMTTTITAFGATTSVVEELIKSSVAYAIEGEYGKDGYNVQNAKYFLMYLKAGENADKYEEAYLASVKAALDDGTLAGVGTLGTTLSVMEFLGVDASDFEGYNVVELFEATEVTENEYSPYNYVNATEAAAAYGLDEYGKALCDQLVTYYEMGVGTDFWDGYDTSPDDVAMFVLGLAPYADDYAEYISDALAVLETFDSAGGYVSWGEANANSTALALAAYSVVGNKEKADETFDKLLIFYDASTGGFTASYNEIFATTDAIFGMEYYLPLTVDEPDPLAPGRDEPEEEESTTKAPAKETTTEETTQATEKAPAKSPVTGTASGTAIAFASIALAGAAVMLSKKKSK